MSSFCQYQNGLGNMMPWLIEYQWIKWIIWLVLIWSLIWKGIALWKSARLKDKWWFIALLVINTAGILEILYIYVFSKKKEKSLQNPSSGLS